MRKTVRYRCNEMNKFAGLPLMIVVFLLSSISFGVCVSSEWNIGDSIELVVTTTITRAQIVNLAVLGNYYDTYTAYC